MSLTFLSTSIYGILFPSDTALLSICALVKDLSGARVSIVNSDDAMPPPCFNDPFTFAQESLLLIKVLELIQLLFHLLHLKAGLFGCLETSARNFAVIFCFVHRFLDVSQSHRIVLHLL